MENLCAWLRRVAAGAVLIGVLASAANAFQPTPCGEVLAPECGGACPAGQRCVPTFQEIVIVIVEQDQATSQPAPGTVPEPECECIEAVCGGVPLADGQGCCNGVPFTIGVQGCCNGQIQSVNEACGCTDDLVENGCCEIEFEGGAQIVEYPPHFVACCQHPLTVDGISANSLGAYTLNSGLDCCVGGAASRLCGGTCQGSECVASGCCTCGDCDVETPFCVAADSPLGCAATCFLEGICFENLASFESGVCTDAGTCQVTAPAPTLSHTGLFAAIGLLVLVAAGALTRRRLASPLY